MKIANVIVVYAALHMLVCGCFAQVLDDPVTLFSSHEWISNIAANVKENVFAVTASAGKDVYFSYSLDRGKKWADFQKINENPGSSDSIVVGDQNELFIFWIEHKDNENHLKFKKCTNDCTKWTETKDIAHNIYQYDNPVIKFKNNKLYVLFSKTWGNSIFKMFKKSDNRGETWSKELLLNKKVKRNKSSTLYGIDGDLIISENQKIYAVWVENKGSYSIAFAESYDDGQSFQRTELIQKTYKIRYCDKCILTKEFSMPRLIEDDHALYLFYIKKSGEKSDLYVTVSKDDYKKWKNPVKLTKGFSYIKDYSVIINNNKFIMNFFKEDKEKDILFYSEITQNPLGVSQHAFLADSKIPGIILKDENGEIYIISSKNDDILKESHLFLAKISQNSHIAGDSDNDGIPDDFEDKLLDKFKPRWFINRDDPANLPIRMEPNKCTPQINATDGTIYGEVFRHDSCMEKICECGECKCTTYHFLEIHYFDLWAKDTLVWPFRRHNWDQEHVAARVISIGHDNPSCDPNWHPADESATLWNPDNWQADLWKFIAHQDTLCEKVKYRNGKHSEGVDVWVSYRHGTFPGNLSCNKPFRFWCTDGCYGNEDLGKPVPINIGQVGYPLNGACWATWNGFLTDKMDPDLPSLTCQYRDSCTTK